MIMEETQLLEIVRPGTGDPVPPGEVGEVVITRFNQDYPLIRFGTGDLSAVLPGRSPCGRTNVRIKGWMGRADQSTKVRAMFVTPGQVADILRRHPEIAARAPGGRGRGRQRPHDAQVRGAGTDPPDLSEAIVASIRDVTKLRGEVELVAPGSLPNDGKVIEDLRSTADALMRFFAAPLREGASRLGELPARDLDHLGQDGRVHPLPCAPTSGAVRSDRVSRPPVI